MNCVTQPQGTVLKEQFSQRDLLPKGLLSVFSRFENFLGMSLPPSPFHTCAWVSLTLYFPFTIFSWEELKSSVQRSLWKFCTSNTVLLNWMFRGSLRYFCHLCSSVAFWSAYWIWPVTGSRYFKRLSVSLRLWILKVHQPLSWARANFHFDILAVIWPHQAFPLN